MITITNGKRTTVVTSGVYRELYAPEGWKIVGESEENTINEEIFSSEEKTSENYENEPSDEYSEDEEVEDKIESEEEDIEKPLSEMSIKELKQFAEEKGIDISSAKNKQDIKAIIAAEMED